MRTGRKRAGASGPWLAVALVFAAISAGSFAAGAVLQNVTPTSATVNCAGWPAGGCVVSAPFTNSGATPSGVTLTPPFTAYFVYKNTLGSTVLVDTQPVGSLAAGSTVTVSDTMPASATSGGQFIGFSVTVFAVDAAGLPAGPPLSQTFTTPIQFTIFYSGVGSVAVSPPGATPSGCTSQCAAGAASYVASWPSGTAVTVTTSGGVAPVYWGSTQSTNCPAASPGPGFTCTFTVSSSLGSVFIAGAAGSLSQQVIQVFAVGGGVTPPFICLSATAYQTATFGNCGPAGAFAFSAVAAWQVVQQNTGAALSPPVQGDSAAAKLNYTQLAPSVSFSAGYGALNLVVSSPATLTMAQAPYGAGKYAATVPPAGTYTCAPASSVCKPGQNALVSVTVPAGQQFNGWIVNAANVGGNQTAFKVAIPLSGPTNVGPTFSPLTTAGGCAGPTCPTTTATAAGPAACALSPNTNAGVNVLVMDGVGKAIPNALVTGAGASAVTGGGGYASLCNFAVPGVGLLTGTQGTVKVTVSAAGYTTTTQEVNVIEGQTTSATVVLQGGASLAGGPTAYYVVGGAFAVVATATGAYGLVKAPAKRRRRA